MCAPTIKNRILVHRRCRDTMSQKGRPGWLQCGTGDISICLPCQHMPLAHPFRTRARHRSAILLPLLPILFERDGVVHLRREGGKRGTEEHRNIKILNLRLLPTHDRTNEVTSRRTSPIAATVISRQCWWRVTGEWASRGIYAVTENIIWT